MVLGRVKNLFGGNSLEKYLEKIELAMEVKRAEYRRLEKEARYALINAREAERKKEKYAALAARHSAEDNLDEALMALARASSYSQDVKLYSHKRQILEQQAENARAIYEALREKRESIRSAMRFGKKNLPEITTEEILEMLGTGKNEVSVAGEEFQLYYDWKEERLDNLADLRDRFVTDMLGSSDIMGAYEALAVRVSQDPMLSPVYEEVGRKIMNKENLEKAVS